MPAYDLCERTFEFSLAILQLWQKLTKTRGFPRALANQLLRSGTSVGANVEEGRAGQSKADFVSKYSIARKEARESMYWLRMFVASRLLGEAEGRPLIKEANGLISILTAIIKKAKGVNTKGEERTKPENTKYEERRAKSEGRKRPGRPDVSTDSYFLRSSLFALRSSYFVFVIYWIPS